MGVFNHCATVARYRNKTFKAEVIRDDVVLRKSQQTKVTQLTQIIERLLTKRGKVWTKSQKNLNTKRIEKKIQAALKNFDYTHTLLKKCKACGRVRVLSRRS